jgi:peptide/nickel transport system substrate-binding protein
MFVEGLSIPGKRSDRVVLEANTDYWDHRRFPQLRRMIFDNTLSQKEAVELVKTGEGRVDVVTGLSPLETLRVAESAFAKVVKTRGSLTTVVGQFNRRKAGSPWHDVRLRQAVNVTINREDLLRYATKGNGHIIPALVPVQAFGYDPHLAPYPFAPDQARQWLRDAGYPQGLALTLVAPEELEVQATVVSKMLEHGGFKVDLQLLDSVAYNGKTRLSDLEPPAEQQTWDIALRSHADILNFPPFEFYDSLALGGPLDWGIQPPALRQLRERILRTVDREQQQGLIRQMERYTAAQAYFLFLYNPIQLYAVNKAVELVPYVSTLLNLDATSVTEQHWSVRQSAKQE